MKKHLCKNCLWDFPTCSAKEIVWGIDVNPGARGKEADMVLACDAYEPTTKMVEESKPLSRGDSTAKSDLKYNPADMREEAPFNGKDDECSFE